MNKITRTNATPVTTPGCHRLAGMALGVLTLASGSLLAQAADETVAATPVTAHSPRLEQMLVVGQAASLDKALQLQRLADSIRSVVSADAVAQLPDENVAEAVQRLPGVSVERDQGEGRFVSVRGLGPDMNSVTINGTLIPAPNSDSRAVALDVLPSELVETLAVVKALTPDMDANSLGGTIEVESLSAYDHDDLFYTGSLEAGYDDNVGETSPKVSGAISDLFSIGGGTDNLGIAAAFSWQERDFGSDNVETGGHWDLDDGERLEETELRDYAITRERRGVGINVDFRPDDDNHYFLHSLYSEFTDTETRQAAGAEFADPLQVGERGDAEAWRELKSRKETQEIQSYVLGSEHHRGPWTFNGQLGYSRSSETTPGHIAGAEFESLDDFSDVGFASTRKPTLRAGSDFYHADLYSLDKVEWEQQTTTDTEFSAKFDVTRDYNWSGNDASLKTGAKISRRDKDNNLNVWVYEDFDDAGIADADLLLSNYTRGSVDYALGQFGPAISASSVKHLLSGLDRADYYDEEESRIGDFTMSEDIDAAYLMNSVDIGKLRIIAGLRYEGTSFTAEGTGLRDGEFEAVTASNDYHHWLPGLHLRYHLDDNTQLRAAWTNTVVRPTFEQLAPGYVIDGDEAEFGNPELKALESANLDLGIERYLGRAGVLSAYLFYKDIDNFVYNADVAGSGIWADFDEASTFANGDSASLYGLELAWSQKLDQLPAPWNGVLLGANLTLSRSDASISRQDESRDIDLPFQSDTVGNVMLGWESQQFSVRLSVNYKSAYLQELSAVDDAAHDLYADKQTFVDLSARYYLSDNLQLTFEAQNITDEAYYVYSGRDHLNAQYEEYGPAFKLGVTFSHF